MARKQKNLVVKFIGDTKHIDKNLSMLEKKFTSIGKKTGSSVAGGNIRSSIFGAGASGMNMMKNAAGGLIDKITSLSPVVKGLIAGFVGLVASMRSAVRAGIQAENAIATLEVTTGNAGEALRLYRHALEASARTPFDPRELASAYAQASQFGINATEQLASGVDFSTLISGMGSFRDAQGQLIGPVRAVNALVSGQVEQIRQYGPEALMAYNRARQAGQIGSQRFIRTLVNEMSQIREIGQMAERQSRTVSGLWSTISGYSGLFWTHISGAAESRGTITLWSNLRDIMKDISDGLNSLLTTMKPTLVEIGAVIGNVMKFMFDIGKAIGEAILPPLQMIWSVFGPILTVIFKIFGYVLKVVGKIVNLIGRLIGLAIRAAANIKGITDGIGEAVGWLQKLITWLEITFMFALNAIDAIIESIVDFFENLPEHISNALNALQGFAESSLRDAGGIRGLALRASGVPENIVQQVTNGETNNTTINEGNTTSRQVINQINVTSNVEAEQLLNATGDQ